MRVRSAWSNAVRRSRLSGLAAAAVVSICATSAIGQSITFPECTREPTPQDIEGAKGAHKAATQWFEKADYDRAIQYWRDAYSLDCTKHALLLNIASAYEKKGDKQAAIDTLQIYVMRAPNAPDAANISEKLINLKNSMKPAPPPTSTAPPPPPPTATTTAPPPPPPPDTSTGSTNFMPWVVVGAGGLMTIVGVILLPVGLGKISNAETICPIRDACNRPSAIDEGNSGRTLTTVGGVFIGAGLAIVGAGLVWNFAFNDPQPTSAALPAGTSASRSTGFVSVSPSAGPGAAGVTVSGAF